ncbi:MAG: hypothetical protein KDD36_00065 [Flavobacteriales bacterium]|nr:hypothetical protein [Flavobacteriales bacterium]
MRRIIMCCCVVYLAGCSGGDDGQVTAQLDSLIQNMDIDTSTISNDVVDDIVKTVPSPLVMSSFLESTGAQFSQTLLHDLDMSDDYASAFEMASNLGVYGADLGYINVYKKNHIAVEYLNVIKRLADGLKVGQFFDFKTMKRMTSNQDNLDSLINITTRGFEDMDSYLKDKNRGVISALILYGGWTEALYIATQVISSMPDPPEDLMDRIGEQKMVLDNLEALLSVYKQQPYFQELLTKMAPMKEAFAGVEISVEEAESTLEEIDGVLTVVDHSKSNVAITPNQFNGITVAIKNIRTHLTKQAP